MKIGIVTYWWSQDNYGQILQCYALQKFLTKIGHEAFLIKYDFTKDIKKQSLFIKLLKAFNIVKLIKYFKEKKHIANVLKEQSYNDRYFNDFKNKYLFFSDNYTSYNDIKTNPPKADAYIVGSDQVWNYWHEQPKKFMNQIHVYFLDFGNKNTKRLAYAASWGVTAIPDSFKQIVKPYLAKFDYIGVREKSGIELCTQCGFSNAEWVCDPTLLLTREDYRSLYSQNTVRKQEKKYILLYLLNSTCKVDLQSIYDFAFQRDLNVIYVTGNGVIDDRPKFFATIPEWLYLVDNAEYVITNSYHCGVFSTIFNKKFGIIPRTDKYSGMNSRFESLFEICGIENRFINENNYDILDKNYSSHEIKTSENFLKILNNLGI